MYCDYSNTVSNAVTGSVLSCSSTGTLTFNNEKLVTQSDLNGVLRKIEKALEEKDETTMFNTKDYGACGLAVHMSMYGLAIMNASGDWVSYDKENNEIVNVDCFHKHYPKAFYTIPVTIDSVERYDIVRHGKSYMVIQGANDDGLIAIDLYSGESKVIVPIKTMFGTFIGKVISIFNFSAMSEDSAMLPFLFSDSNDFDPMMMFMMQNQNNKEMFSNPMMMALMLSKDKDFDPMMMLALSQLNAPKA